MTESVANGNGFTQKEMLVRIDAKVDGIGNKQNQYDIELALIKARVERSEKVLDGGSDFSEKWREEVRAEISGIKTQNARIAGAVAVIVIIANFIAPIALRHL